MSMTKALILTLAALSFAACGKGDNEPIKSKANSEAPQADRKKTAVDDEATKDWSTLTLDLETITKTETGSEVSGQTDSGPVTCRTTN